MILEIWLVLALLLMSSFFFAAAETAMVAVNRYRLADLANKGDKTALRTQSLIAQPENMLSTILICNNTANIAMTSLVTYVTAQTYGAAYIPISTGILTVVVLIVAEILPKTLSATFPDAMAKVFTWPLFALVLLLSPLVRIINLIGVGLFKVVTFGKTPSAAEMQLTTQELGEALKATSDDVIPDAHKLMLLNALDAETFQVRDAMLPIRDIEGIDINLPAKAIKKCIRTSRYRRLPVYRGTRENLIGLLYLHRFAGNPEWLEDLSAEKLESLLAPFAFVPETSPINTQIARMHDSPSSMAAIVDEHGAITGVITRYDLLAHVFSTLLSSKEQDQGVVELDDKRYRVEGATTTLSFNNISGWNLPEDAEVRTVGGLIMEETGELPTQQTEVNIPGYKLAVDEIEGNRIKSVVVTSTKDDE